MNPDTLEDTGCLLHWGVAFAAAHIYSNPGWVNRTGSIGNLRPPSKKGGGVHGT